MTAQDIGRQLEEEGFGRLTPEQAGKFELYLELLMKWKQKISLTSIRTEAEIVSRHFGESLLCARNIPEGTRALLDFGTGAGFPGVPCAICNPSVRVALSEAQAKKTVFLREVQRALGVEVSIHQGRVEAMPASSRFNVVTLRAVERMEVSCRVALKRVDTGGSLLILTTTNALAVLRKDLGGVIWEDPVPVPHSTQRILARGRKIA